LAVDLRRRNIVSKRWKTRKGQYRGGQPFSRGALYYLLRNRVGLGEVAHKGQVHKGEHPAILPRALWDQVQAKLDAGRRTDPVKLRSRGNYLLAGLIYDDRGNRMTPSHVKKRNGQRYRYYLSQALLQHRKEAAGSLPRIAAPAIEELVADRVARLTPSRVTGSTQDVTADADTVRRAILHVEVGKQRVTINLGSAAIKVDAQTARLRLPAGDKVEQRGDTLSVEIAIRLKNWGGETVIEGPNGAAAVATAHLDRNLIKAIIRAHEWRDALACGTAKSFRAIARNAGCTEGYVRQIVELAFLAPEITTSILRGTQARQITVDRLVRQPIPLSWREQRRVFGLVG
jgi:hypothetical protein